MEAIKISNTELNELLTPQVKESTVLSDDAKKVLAVILKYHLISSKAIEEGYLICPNSVLRESCEMNMNDVLKALDELQLCSLIVRNAGKRRAKNTKPQATSYHIQWQNLNKEVVKETPIQALLKMYANRPETSMGTATTTAIPTNASTNSPTNATTNAAAYTAAYTSTNTNTHAHIYTPNNSDQKESLDEKIARLKKEVEAEDNRNLKEEGNEASLDSIFIQGDFLF